MTPDRPPLVSVVIPAHERPGPLARAARSALAQGGPGLDVEVVVVDDGSQPPLTLPGDPALRVVRHEVARGVSAARNAGLTVARGRWVTFLDDDDELVGGALARALDALEGSTLPEPRAAIGAIEVVDDAGRVLDRRVPPAAHPRGDHFQLEPLAPGCSHETKQTLVVGRELLLSLGGFDERLRLRELSDLALRLNPVCSIVGVPQTAYRLTRAPAHGDHRSRQAERVEAGMRQLIVKHRTLLRAHPTGYADLLLGQARTTLLVGPRRAAPGWIARALRVAPRHTLRTAFDVPRAVAVVRHRAASA